MKTYTLAHADCPRRLQPTLHATRVAPESRYSGPIVTTIAIESPRQPEIESMLREGAEFALALYPPEGCFLLDLDELVSPSIDVFVARDPDGEAIGMAALVDNGDTTGELKRMFVRDEARGKGVAIALLDALEAAARERDLLTLRLETGVHHTAAMALYARQGYARIDAFGPYVDSPYSVCMEKSLS